MGMKIEMVTPVSAITAIMKQSVEIMRIEVQRALSYLGEQSVAKIRDRSFEESWIDHTGNLRSSIGYAIYDYGKEVVKSAFPVVRQGSEGRSEGNKYVDELAHQYSNVFALVVVAAMSYAEYVEAIDGKEVLASTEIWEKSQMNTYLEKAKQRAEKKSLALMDKN